MSDDMMYMLVKPAKVDGTRHLAGAILPRSSLGRLPNIGWAVPVPAGAGIESANAPTAEPEPSTSGSAEDYSSLNTDEFIAAVESGELSPDEALEIEMARKNPRKGVLEALGAE